MLNIIKEWVEAAAAAAAAHSRIITLNKRFFPELILSSNLIKGS